jgi:hypothetical protein
VTRLRQFVLVVPGEPSEEQVELLLDANDDACIETDPPSGEAWISFDREAPSLVDAIVTGVRDLRCAGLEPARVRDDDDVVTLGVIAQRVGRSETAVRAWADGLIGPGNFPPPIVEHARRPCYRWSEVEPWLKVHFGYKAPDAAATLRAVNLALELRALTPDVDRMAAIRRLLTS